MLRTLLTFPYRFLRLRSLRAKLLFPIIGLMVISLLGSTMAFLVGTALTRNQLVKQQVNTDVERVSVGMDSRVETLETAASLLADDPDIVSNVSEETQTALDIVNSRAVAMRTRFDLDLIQLYDQFGEPHTNLVLSSLYRESSLLDYVEPEQTVVRVIAERVILLRRAEILDVAGKVRGSVIVGIDLNTELHRFVSDYRLFSDITLSVSGIQISTCSSFTNGELWVDGALLKQKTFAQEGLYSRYTVLELGETPVDLVFTRLTTDVRQVMNTGLTVMIVSTLLTTLFLMGLSVGVTGAIAQPIQQLSEAASSVARGNLSQRVDPQSLASLFGIGEHDEIGGLARSFNSMVSELQDLYMNLEAKVDARTQELVTSAAVAHAVSTSLELDVVLRKSVQLIQQRLGFDYVGVFVVDPELDVAVLRQATNFSPPEALDPDDEAYLRVDLRGDSLISLVATAHASRVAQDIEVNDTAPAHLMPKTRSVAVLPLLAGNVLVGVLDVQSQQPYTFAPERLSLLKALADQIAMGVQNAQLYESEQHRRYLTELLELTGRALSSSLDLQKVPGRVLSLLNSLIPYDRGALLMKQGEVLYPLAHYGFPDDQKTEALILPINEGDVFEQLVETRVPLVINDVIQDPRWRQVAWLPLHRSWLGAPIVSKGRVIGMVSLTRRASGAFSAEDATWVQAVAMQAGIALDNADLYAQVLQFNEKLELMVQERTVELNRAYEVLEQLDNTKRKFINVAAHELRTPLTVIKAYAQVLCGRFKAEEQAEVLKMLSGILSGANRLHEIVNSMLDMARIDNQTLQMVRHDTDMANVIHDVCASLKQDLQTRNLKLRLQDLESLPLIQADAELLNKVFYQLVINAIKYTPDGGQIRIYGDVGEDEDAVPYVDIVVADTGIGIDPQHQEVIFEKFYQASELAFHSSGRTKFKGGGPGLGLAIARGIVLAHGGDIWVESAGYNEEDCPGSEFYVRLPVGCRIEDMGDNQVPSLNQVKVYS